MSQPTGTLVLTRSAETVDRASRSESIINPAMYGLTAGSDRLFLCEVVRNGLGQEVHGHPEVFVADPGDIAMLLENRISYRVQIGGEKHYLVRNNVIAGILNPETYAVKTVNHYVLVKPAEDRAVAFESRGTLWVPTDQMATDDEQNSKLRRPGLVAGYGEVVDVGPGRWDEGMWKEPQCRKGDLVFFDASHSTLSCTIRGKPHTLVPCDQIGLIAESAA
jgi:hypothetical protein